MKKFVTFECEVDGQKQVVQVSVLHGDGTLQILINKRFIMDVDFRRGKWTMLHNNDSWLGSDELTIFLDELGCIE